MTRRRLCWLCLPLLVLAIGVAAWYMLAQRDADIHVIGPKTRGVRANFALIESKVDTAEFHDCKSVAGVLQRLDNKWTRAEKFPEGAMIDWFGTRVTIDDDALAREKIARNVGVAPVRFSPEHQTMSVKDLLRTTFRQAGVAEPHFIIRAYNIEATTLKRAQDERDQYLAGVTLYDRMRQMWSEMTGAVAEDQTTFVVD